ncbi:MAG: hypothetical protein AAB415_01535 [Patescibacteria group bacterium]
MLINTENKLGMLADHFRLTAMQRAALERLGLVTVEDLLRHFPSR